MSTILITGCSRGIGRTLAEDLTRRGHEVIATARRTEDLTDLDVARRLRLDVTDDASVQSVAEEVEHLDVLINNAGIALQGPLEHTPVDAASALFDINVFGVLRTTRALLPALRQSEAGLVLNVSSVVGRIALPLVGVYSASKAALEAISETLAFEVEDQGVRVSVLEPGYVSSGGVERSATYFPEDASRYAKLVEALQASISSASTPQQVADTVADIVERRQTAFRVPVGESANALLSARSELNDDQFAGALRANLNLA